MQLHTTYSHYGHEYHDDIEPSINSVNLFWGEIKRKNDCTACIFNRKKIQEFFFFFLLNQDQKDIDNHT